MISFTALADRARALRNGGNRAILGITGPPGAGKSTLAEELLAALEPPVGHVPMDGFHLADVELDRLGLRDRKGAPDTFDAPIRPLLAEVWYTDLDHTERMARLVARHIRFGKPEPAAIAWANGTDERNAAVIAATRDRADVLVPSDLIRGLGTAPA